jgi:3-hydroxyacyl-[acyl-carrier-protein] dehydratase
MIAVTHRGVETPRSPSFENDMRWIWIDRFLEFNSGRSARAVKNLSLAEDHFGQHFPGYPVMAASLILEGLAQTGGILAGEANGFAEKVVLAKVPRATFHDEARPGEQLIYDVELVHMRPEGASVTGRVTAGGRLIAEADIFFAHLDQSRSQQLFGTTNFVFTGEMKYLIGKLTGMGAKANTASSPAVS